MKLIRGQVFLTTGEVALNFGVTTRTILRWSSSADGNGPRLKPVKGPNNRLYFRQQEVDQVLDFYFGAGNGNHVPESPSTQRVRVSARAPHGPLATAR